MPEINMELIDRPAAAWLLRLLLKFFVILLVIGIGVVVVVLLVLVLLVVVVVVVMLVVAVNDCNEVGNSLVAVSTVGGETGDGLPSWWSLS